VVDTTGHPVAQLTAMGLHLIEQITVLGAAEAAPRVQDVLIDGDRFAIVAPHIEGSAFRVDERTDGRGKLMMPGLINAHHHSHDRFDKGRFSPLPLEIWMSLYNPPTHDRGWTADEVYLRTLLNGVEMLRGGTTSVVDDIHFGGVLQPALVDAAFRAYQTLGIRADVGIAWCDRPFHEAIPHLAEVLPPALQTQTTAGRPSAREVLGLWRSLSRDWNGRCRFVVSPSAPQRCSERFLTEAWDLAAAAGLQVHVHVLETRIQALTAQRLYGVSMIEFMRRLGILTPNAVLAHGIWVSASDLDKIADAHATIVHNPACNLKLGSGVAPVAEMLARGINVALGTDNNGGNDSNSMFDAMRLACLAGSLVSKTVEPVVNASCSLNLATEGGALAMRSESEVGRIAAGYLADFCLLDTQGSAFTPLNDPVTQLVFCEQGQSLTGVYVGGRKLVDRGRVTSIDERELWEEVADRLSLMQAKVQQGIAYAERLRPYLETAYQRCREEPWMAALKGAQNLIDLPAVSG
jgi:5-methylthioadenosine/S-adenosylhomocysteine deaminase